MWALYAVSGINWNLPSLYRTYITLASCYIQSCGITIDIRHSKQETCLKLSTGGTLKGMEEERSPSWATGQSAEMCFDPVCFKNWLSGKIRFLDKGEHFHRHVTGVH